MHYPNVTSAVFLSRPNRFVAQVLLEGEVITVHVKNTGRCRELLLPGAQVWLTKSTNPNRKTAYDLIAVQKGARLINMDAQAPIRSFMNGPPPATLSPSSPYSNRSAVTGTPALIFTGRPGPARALSRSRGLPWRGTGPPTSLTPPPSGA